MDIQTAKQIFDTQGGISELFDSVAVFMNLRAVIERINRNAVAA